MTHRDRFWGLSGRKRAAGDAQASARLADALRQAPEATGTAAVHSFRAASTASCYSPHLGDKGAKPKALKGRPYGSLLSPFGISRGGRDFDADCIGKRRRIDVGNHGLMRSMPIGLRIGRAHIP
jgi:hypothetical protein